MVLDQRQQTTEPKGQTMPDNPPPTCKDRILPALAGRIETLSDIMHRLNSDDANVSDDAAAELDTFPLDVEVRHTMRVLIGTGGPGDWLDIPITRTKYGWELADDAATYVFQDWFDSADIRTDDETIMGYLAQMVEGLPA
jgi:hypothetical protein